MVLCLFENTSAQIKDDCGYQLLFKDASLANASLKERIDSSYYATLHFSQSKKKSQYYQTLYNIPVIFHIILNKEQLSILGGEDGVKNRIEKQLTSLNADYSGLNVDSSQIPAPFKPLFANTIVQFGLAHTSPNGFATPGYEIKIIEKQGVNYSSATGSGLGFSDAKYINSDGLQAWDPTVYLNIWVINPLLNGNATNITGMTLPFDYSLNDGQIPLSEVGIILHYGAMGIKETAIDFYLPGRSKGRTLTHEIGHFFSLRHPWGDDNGLCPDNGGHDDGIDDTPSQSDAVFGCPSFPKYDLCTSDNNGVLYSNFMNYSDDNCRSMFTVGQAGFIGQKLTFGNQLFGLTQHPELLSYPTFSKEYDVTVSPNPAFDKIAISFSVVPKDLERIQIWDAQGRVLISESIPKGYYVEDVTKLSKGWYIVLLKFINGVRTYRFCKL